jgi:2-hydroxychromene-2-carboxylate isomerase
VDEVAPAASKQPVFFYDLGSPACYLAAETIMATLPVVPEWEPVLGSEIAAGNGTARDRAQGSPGSWSAADREEVERLAEALGLQPVRWPTGGPPNSERAMLAATYAKKIGRAVAFSLAAFRQAFAGGRDLGDENTILIAGAACEMHPTALRKGLELATTHAALTAAGARARDAGVTALPAIRVGERTYHGRGAIEAATAALTGATK